MKFFILDDDIEFLEYFKNKILLFFEHKNIAIELQCQTSILQLFLTILMPIF